MPTILTTIALWLTAAAILATIAILLRPEPLIVHRGATGGWSPIADLGEVAQAATEAPADLTGDLTPHALRMHLASEHMLPEALDLDDFDAEQVHQHDHTHPDVHKLHGVHELTWDLDTVQRARLALEAGKPRVVAGGWRDLIKPPAVPELLASLPNPLPIVRGNTDGQPYRSRHHEDTVEMVTQAHAMPEEIHDPALAAFVHGDNGAAA
jgi:hypothetical protein